MESTMRWYGPEDGVPLSALRQAGCTGVVTALHEVPAGELWKTDAIWERKRLVEAAGMRWSVAESIPVPEDVKLGLPGRDALIANYCESVRNLGRCGVGIVAYNFMAVVDWTRTDLEFEWHDGSSALAFDAVELASFDLFDLERPGAFEEHGEKMTQKARERWDGMAPERRSRLRATILQGLPGKMTKEHDIDSFRAALKSYEGVDLRANLRYFIAAVAPVAEESGVLLAIHPDDPPISLFGLPRVVSTQADVDFLLAASASPSNGLCFCAGSFASRRDNDVTGMARKFAQRIHFVHLRNVRRTGGGSFVESDHLVGDVDVYQVVKTLLEEQTRRLTCSSEEVYARMPMRPDHGHQMLDDLDKTNASPGYTAIGRLRGLAELNGLQHAIKREKAPSSSSS